MRKLNLKQRQMLHFPDQRKDEQVILLLRRHWTVIAGHVARLAMFMIVPVVVFGLLYSLGWTVEVGGPLYVLAIMAVSLYYIFIWIFYFHEFVDYHLDIWIVTDQRIVSIEQAGLFNRTTSEHSILKVQDVTAEVKGKTQTFLDFGYVHVQTAAESQRFVFSQVPQPRTVAKIIMKVHDEAVQKAGVQEKVEAANVLEANEQQSHGITQ